MANKPKLNKPDSSGKPFYQVPSWDLEVKSLKRITGLKKLRTTDTHFKKEESLKTKAERLKIK